MIYTLYITYNSMRIRIPRKLFEEKFQSTIGQVSSNVIS